jgi:hypothetical protein
MQVGGGGWGGVDIYSLPKHVINRFSGGDVDKSDL